MSLDWSLLELPDVCQGGAAAAESLKGNPLAGHDLLRLLDLTPEELHLVLAVAVAQKQDWQAGIHDKPYQDEAVAIIMEKPSLRTRISFEVGAKRLGAHPAVMADKNSAFSRGEAIKDTVQVLERFVDCVVLRTFEQSKVAEVAEWASIPVINALTDDFHPCQGLADFMCMYEHKGDLQALKIAYVGDGNNMAHTYLEGAALIGCECTIATPEGYEPQAAIVKECQEQAKATGAILTIGHDPQDALIGADVVITDTWASMGQESEHESRVNIFEPYQINAETIKLAKADAIFMHCLPAHRGEEVTDAIMDGTQAAIYDEAEDRLHAQKALMSLLMADK